MGKEKKDLDEMLIYLKLMDKLNWLLLRMYNVSILSNNAIEELREYFFIFSNTFLQITGYASKNSKSGGTGKKSYSLCKNNGILALESVKKVFDFHPLLEKLLSENYEVIEKLILCRNKVQHKVHSLIHIVFQGIFQSFQ